MFGWLTIFFADRQDALSGKRAAWILETVLAIMQSQARLACSQAALALVLMLDVRQLLAGHRPQPGARDSHGEAER